MVIGFDAKRAFMNRTGLGNYSRNLISSLLMFNPEHQYILYTPRNTKLPENAHWDSYDTCIIRTPPIYLRPIHPLWRSWFIKKEIQHDSVDIFHGLSHELPISLPNAMRKVVTMHDLIFMRYPELYPAVDRFFYRKKYFDACQRADKIIAISEQTKQDLVEFFHVPTEKIHVIYQSASAHFYSSASEETKQALRLKYNLPEKYILYVGSILPRKNILNLVKAIHHIFQEMNIVLPLVLIGEGKAYLEEVKNYVSAAGLQSVYFIPRVSVDVLPAFYQMAHTFVYPSIFEGFGIPIIEALHSGTPVISSTGSCFSEAGGAGSLYVSPLSYTDLAEAIFRVWSDTILHADMSAQGLAYVQRFMPHVLTKELMKFYFSV